MKIPVEGTQTYVELKCVAVRKGKLESAVVAKSYEVVLDSRPHHQDREV